MCLRIAFIQRAIRIQNISLTKWHREAIVPSANKEINEECVACGLFEQCQSIETASDGVANAHASQICNKCQGNNVNRAVSTLHTLRQSKQGAKCSSMCLLTLNSVTV